MSSAEQSARKQLSIAASASTICAFVAISLGLNRLQSVAVVFLLIALVAASFAWLAYSRYSRLRQARWDAELTSAVQTALQEEDAANSGDVPNDAEPLEG